MALLGLLSAGARAQSGADTTAGAPDLPPPQVTLEGWAHDLRVALWDRGHAVGGDYYDRGVLRYRTPRMDHEYDLDLFTFGFSLADDAAFYAAENGVRAHGGSITTTELAARSQIRAATPLAGRFALRVDVDQQDDRRARRLALRLAYDADLGGGHRLGLTHSLAQDKPDLDFGLVYGYRDGRGFTVDVGVTALDAFNNVIYDGLVVSPFIQDTLRTYRAAPLLATARIAARPLPRLRVEGAVGLQTRAVADVETQQTDSVRFTYADAFRYGGLLVEAEVLPRRVNAGAVAQLTYSTSTRTAGLDTSAPADYTTAQPYSRLGLFALGRYGIGRVETWVFADHYADRQTGTLFGGATVDGPYLFEERRTWVRAEVGVAPLAALDASLGFEADFRRFPAGEGLRDPYYVFKPYRPNRRLTVRAAYAFSAHARVRAGLSADLDGDLNYRGAPWSLYDGAFVQLFATW